VRVCACVFVFGMFFSKCLILLQKWPYFTHIDLSDNNLQDAGVITMSTNFSFMVNMQHFNISNNGIQTTCNAELEKIIRSFSALQSFDISKNNLGDYTASVVVSALKSCKFLASVNMHSTHAGLKTGHMLGEMISVCKDISMLNLAWNQLRSAGGAALLLKGVLASPSVKILDLSWNGFGDNDCSSAIAKVLAANTVLESLDLRFNRLTSDSCSFMAPGVKKNTTLTYLNLSNNPVGDNGSRIIYKAAAQSEEVMKLKQDHHERALLMNDCGLGISQNDQFDPSDPAGKYTLDMSETKSQNVLLSLFHLVASGSGAFTTGSCKLDDQHVSIFLRGDWESEPMFTDGILEFEFENLRCKPKAKNVVPDSEVAMIVKLLQDASETSKMSLMDMLLCGDTFLSLKQCLLLLSQLKDGILRVNFVQRATNKLFESTLAHELVSALSEEDNLILQSRMSDASKNFHPNSVNGHYKLQLGKDCDRNIFYALCERRNRWKMSTELICREPIEFCFMNMKYNKTIMEFKPSWRCPKEGVLEFDYCDQERSLPTDPVLYSLEKMRELILCIPDEVEIVQNLRRVTGEFFLISLCAKEVLDFLKLQQSRVEAFIILMPKIYDYCACGPIWFSLSQDESRMVEQRMGLHNLFHFSWAVRFWELDLANNIYHRYVLAVLVDLAVVEPGENMVDVRLNGLCFEVPAAWVKAIPAKGLFSVHYCRSKAVIQDIVKNLPPHWVNPESDWVKSQPYDTEWVDWSMRFRIRNKLAASFSTPAQGFAVMDEDGGGSLSRQEISRGM
jgi:Ran GTPase-activating protein (RanGAP) involved in mRNA processing and transport